MLTIGGNFLITIQNEKAEKIDKTLVLTHLNCFIIIFFCKIRSNIRIYRYKLIHRKMVSFLLLLLDKQNDFNAR